MDEILGFFRCGWSIDFGPVRRALRADVDGLGAERLRPSPPPDPLQPECATQWARSSSFSRRQRSSGKKRRAPSSSTRRRVPGMVFASQCDHFTSK